jgi:hypothetical protein
MPTMKVYNNWVMIKEIVWADLQTLHETLVPLVK